MLHSLASDLERLFPGSVERQLSLSRLSRWRIGGTADLVVSPSSVSELVRLRMWLHEKGVHSVLIAGTSNLLFDDSGLHCVAIRIGSKLSRIDILGEELHVEAGAWVPGLARMAMKAGLSGIEHTCGIPGTAGGLVCMNGGSMRRGIGEVVESVNAVLPNGETKVYSKAECEFAYRHSVFQSNGEAIASVVLKLVQSDGADIRRLMLSILRDRRSKFPQKLPNCGSVFVSDPAMYEEFGPPGRVIELAGLKGLVLGDAMISPQHANFIVNRGKASSSDVLHLIGLVRDAVEFSTGYRMKVEARFVSPDGDIKEI